MNSEKLDELQARIIGLSGVVTNRGHGLVWWCCDMPFVPLGESPHDEECFFTGAQGLIALVNETVEEVNEK